MKSLKSLALTSALLLTGGIALAGAPQSAAKAQNSATPPQTKEYQAQSMKNNGEPPNPAEVHHLIGTVDSITNSTVTVSHNYKGEHRTTDFTVQPSAKKQGNIQKGDRVEISYKNVNSEHVAIALKAEPPAG